MEPDPSALTSTSSPSVALAAGQADEKEQPAPLKKQLVVLLRRFGGPEAFELVEQPIPVAGRGEVRVRVLAASVQFTDIILRKGKYPDLHQKPPLVLGYDVVGEIDEVGASVAGFRVGDCVADLTMVGSYAQYRTLRAENLIPVPPGVDSAEADTLILSWATAYQLLHREARVQPGQRMLIVGAAGAVGQALIALGKLAGLEVWGIARAAQVELVRSLGATPIDSEIEAARLSAYFDVVFDGVGEGGWVGSWARVKKGGRLCAFGFAAAVANDSSFLKLGLWLLRLHLWSWLPTGKTAGFFSIMGLRKQHPDWYRADLEVLFRLLSGGVIHPRVAKRIGLADVPDAHREIEAGGMTGKIVICEPSGSRPRPGQPPNQGDGAHTARGFGTLDSDRRPAVRRDPEGER